MIGINVPVKERFGRNVFLVITLAAFTAGLVSCGIVSAGSGELTPTNPNEIFTAVAQTLEARSLGIGEGVPTLPPQDLIRTRLAPTDTSLPYGTQVTTTPSPSATNTQLATIVAASKDDRAEFLEDVTIPDGTVLIPGESFIKTWRLENVGKTTWTRSYQAVFVEGSILGGPASVELAEDVPPGGKINISVELVAPSKKGQYKGEWMLKNSRGEFFGVGENGSDPFWVDVLVPENLTAQRPGFPTSGSGLIRNIFFEVDQEDVAAGCPHTFVFTGYFTLSENSPVTYRLEAETPNYVFEVKLPPAASRNLKAGEHQVVYELKFNNSVKGWARLVFSYPMTVKSNHANFSLECR